MVWRFSAAGFFRCRVFPPRSEVEEPEGGVDEHDVVLVASLKHRGVVGRAAGRRDELHATLKHRHSKREGCDARNGRLGIANGGGGGRVGGEVGGEVGGQGPVSLRLRSSFP
jgi:hypothetical protein